MQSGNESKVVEKILINAEEKPSWLNLRELYHYRELLFVLTARDIKVRYKQTALGMMWALLQPLANMLLFTIIFISNFPAGTVLIPPFD